MSFSERVGDIFAGYDFSYFYGAGKLVQKGENFYNNDLLATEMAAFGWPERPYGFPYPPWSLPFYYPFSHFSFAEAKFWWFLTSCICLILAATCVLRSQVFHDLIKDPLQRATILFASLLFFPSFKLLVYGQTTFLIAIALGGFVLFKEKKQSLLAGAAFSLAMLKPHLLAPCIAAQLIQAMKSRDFTFLFGFGSTFLFICLLAELLSPNIFQHYSEYIGGYATQSRSLPFPTLGYFLSFQGTLPWVSVALTFMGITVAVIFSVQRQISLRSLVLHFIPISLLVAPYSWTHDFILLYLHYVIFLGWLFAVSKVTAYAFVLLQFVVGIALVRTLSMECYMVWFPVLIGSFGMSIPSTACKSVENSR